ncbi:MAG: amino acid racemase [Elusimicrobiota bacterium]|jgi:aspartate racemase|nr:amino acid racemase [Elusimicrobiota bacterium]
MSKKTIGIIGGMGPEATSDLFSKIISLTPAQKDQEHIRIIIDNNPQIPDRTAFILVGGENPLKELLRSAELLKKAGADILIMPCNTAHFFLPDIKREIGLPFISIIDSAINDLKEFYPKAIRIAILATTGTKAAKIYDEPLIKDGKQVLDFSKEIQDNIMAAIYDGVKKGKAKEASIDFQKTINKIENDLKPDVFIAACTEIPILMQYAVSKTPVIDATMSLAKAAVKYAL